METPFLTADVEPIRGVVKARPEDFFVEEIPAYERSGEGTHVFFTIEKTGWTTVDAVRAIARALGVSTRAIGYAGNKDSRAVTRQTLSVEHVDPERVRALAFERLRVVDVGLHGNKLRVGHLAGNRFAVKVREMDAGRLDDARRVLDVVDRRGMPNYFGEQRFGVRGDTWQVGRALLRGDSDEAVAILAGRPGPLDAGRVRRAREAFDAGDYEASAKAWPGAFRDAQRLCRGMARYKGDARKALRSLERTLLRFFVSAYQSRLFNLVLAERIESLERLEVGDLAWRHANGAVFRVEDLAAEAPRAEQFEISASGPLFGRRMTAPTGRPAEIERAVLEREEHEPEDFARPGPLQWQGARRPLRVRPKDLAVESGSDEHGPFVEFRFALPPGSYATILLGEVLKGPRGPAARPVS